MSVFVRTCVVLCSLLAALSAEPLSTADLGVPKYIQVFAPGPYPVLNGGGFSGEVSQLANSIVLPMINSNGSIKPGQDPFSSSIQTTFWCVDSQLTFTNGSKGWANIVSINGLPSSSVRYGTIDDTSTADGDPAWTNTSVGSTLLPTGSQDRFLMAAWLVNQYGGFPNGPVNNAFPQSAATDSKETARNENIQRAIWAVIHNSTSTADTSGYSAITGRVDGDVDDNGANPNETICTTNANCKDFPRTVAYWVDQARQNFTSVDPTKWAVVSWLANSSGVLQDGPNNNNLTNDRQTFLVQVVPEPGFYGLLAGCLGGLVWLQRRRRISA